MRDSRIRCLAEGRSALSPARAGRPSLVHLDRVALSASRLADGVGQFSSPLRRRRVHAVRRLHRHRSFTRPETSSARRYDCTQGGALRAGSAHQPARRGGHPSSATCGSAAGCSAAAPPRSWRPRGAATRGIAPRRAPRDGEATGTTAASARPAVSRRCTLDAWAVAGTIPPGLYPPAVPDAGGALPPDEPAESLPRRATSGSSASLAHEYRCDGALRRVGRRRSAWRRASRTARVQARDPDSDRGAYIATSSGTFSRSGTRWCPATSCRGRSQFYGVRWDFWN